MKIDLDTFRQSNLAVGTVLACRPHPALPGLSVVTVQLDEPVEALSASSALPAEPVGHRLVVATGLHPVRVGDEQYRGCVVSGGSSGAAVVAGVPDHGMPDHGVPDHDVPDGSRLE